MPNQWWKQSNQGGGKPVKAWTPDPTRYHAPDSQESMRMGMGVVSAAMIPRANNDGTSKGFDAGRAGVFTVDPDKPGGGVAIDPAMMNNTLINNALARVGTVGGDDEEEQNNAFAALTIIAQNGAETDPDLACVVTEADERSQSGTRPGRAPLHHPGRTPARQQHAVQEIDPVDDVIEPGPGDWDDPSFVPGGSAMPHTRRSAPQPVQHQIEETVSQPRMSKQAAEAPGQSVQLTNAQTSAMLQLLLQQMQHKQPAPTTPIAATPIPRRAVQAKPGAPRLLRPVRQQPPPLPPPVEEPKYEEQAYDDSHLDEPAEEVIEDVEYPLVEEQQEVYEESYEPEPPPPAPPARRTVTQPIRRAPQPQLGRQHRPSQVQPPQTIRRTVADHAAQQPQRVESIDSLKIAFLKDVPEKPQRRVIFDFGSSGTMQTRYHEVIEGAGCLILVYDNRYEDGIQFMPPDRETEPVSVFVADTNKRYKALSLGMTFNMGQLDFVVLTLSANVEDHGNLHAGAEAVTDEQAV
jgi:hypothetical protein